MSSQREAYQLPNQRTPDPSQSQSQAQAQSQAQTGAYTPSYGGGGTGTGTGQGGFGGISGGGGSSGNENAASAMGIMGPGLNRAQDVTYICGECAAKVALNLGDAIRCKECGHRVLYKERTKR